MHIQHDIRIFRQRGLQTAGDGDHGNAEALQMRQQIEQFRGFPAVAEQDRQIAVINDAKVAMQRVADIQQHGRGPGAVQRGGQLAADAAALAHAANDELPPAAHAGEQEVDGLSETVVDARM